MFNHRLRYLLIVALATYSYLNAVFAQVFELYSIQAGWYICLLTMLMLTLAVWEGNRMIAFHLDKKRPVKASWGSLMVAFGIGTIFSCFSAILITWMMGVFIVGIPVSALRLSLKLTLLYATRINLFLHTINAVFVFLVAYKQKELEAESLQRMTIQAQLQAIRNQVNPHFLFNNLNVLSGLVIKDNPEANEFVEAFSKVYRRILNTQHEELVTLESEIEYIQPYIYLLKKRFADGLTVILKIPDHFRPLKAVPGALQILIENAIKHNIVSKKNPLIIDISVNGTGMLVVTNNLQIKDTLESSTRIGLNNIRQRYEMTTGRTILVRQENDFFSVSLPLLT